MNKVYVLYHTDCVVDDDQIEASVLGVFSSREIAEQEKIKFLKQDMIDQKYPIKNIENFIENEELESEHYHSDQGYYRVLISEHIVDKI